jgi:hypothetical protein
MLYQFYCTLILQKEPDLLNIRIQTDSIETEKINNSHLQLHFPPIPYNTSDTMRSA